MKVLYVAPFATSEFSDRHGDTQAASLGGMRKVSLIAEALAQYGNQVVILSSVMLSNSKFAWRKSFREQLHYGDKTVEVIYPSAFMLRPFGGLLNCLRTPWIIQQLLKDFVPEVAIIYNTYLFESLAAKELVRRLKIPIVLEIEDLPLARRREWFNIKPWLDQRSWGAMLNLSMGFTAVNGLILDQLPDNKPKYLLPGVIDNRLEALSRKRIPPFNHSQRIVGYFGALAIEKGIQVLLDLVPRLPPEWRLVVSGTGPLSSEFESLGQLYPAQMTFHGRLNVIDLYEVMCQCDCTVIPLEQIPGHDTGVFPFKTFEFIVAGTHVIASRLSKLRDLDLSFVQRWDGENVDSLLEHLSNAEIEFKQEQAIRDRTISAILDRYSVSGVKDLFTTLLSV